MGLFNYIKSALGGNGKEAEKETEQPAEKETKLWYNDIINTAYHEMQAKGYHYWWSVKASEISSFNEKLLTLPDKQKATFIATAVSKIHAYHKGRKGYSSEDK
ncbi:MAG: hypothetical protein IPN43_09255, partial [Chitinophagaceae bacterium]|nr:hypothetical protein [Chitinophagaceae bacterium]